MRGQLAGPAHVVDGHVHGYRRGIRHPEHGVEADPGVVEVAQHGGVAVTDADDGARVPGGRVGEEHGVARLMSAATEPVAGVGPSGEGPVGSGFVAMKREPAAISLIASVMRSKL